MICIVFSYKFQLYMYFFSLVRCEKSKWPPLNCVYIVIKVAYKIIFLKFLLCNGRSMLIT